MTDADLIDRLVDRYGHLRITWDPENRRRPLDRWGRSAEEIRAHVELVAALADELRQLAARCEAVLMGREAGSRFWSRFAANITALEHVVERDDWYAEVLEAEARRLADRAVP